MAEFTDSEKAEIVTMLAQYVAVSKIVEVLGERGIQTDYRQVAGYDPRRAYYEAGEKWKELFEAQRKLFVEDMSIIPSANKAFRINLLEEAALEARRKGETTNMAALLKQIAEETGGVLTNKRQLDVNHNDLSSLSEEDRATAVARLFDQALRPDGPPPGGSLQ